MTARDNIIEIINNPNLGAVQLEFEYKKLKDISQQNDFFYILKEILKNSSDKEKAICYTAIDMLGKALDFEELVKKDIENIKMTQSQSLINSLLWLAAALSDKSSIYFIQQVINYFKPQKGEYSYLYNMGIRSLISTNQWRIIISEIIWTVENNSDSQNIDFFAYFKWKREESEFKELFQKIMDNSLLGGRMKNLELKIKERYLSNYDK